MANELVIDLGEEETGLETIKALFFSGRQCWHVADEEYVDIEFPRTPHYVAMTDLEDGVYSCTIPVPAGEIRYSVWRVDGEGTRRLLQGSAYWDGTTLFKSRLDLAQVAPTTNDPNTLGDCFNAARAQGFGKWAIVDGDPPVLSLYAPDGTTVVASFNLAPSLSATSRTPV